MAITFADKNRNAAVGTPESQISDDDINALKRGINDLDGIVTGSATIVSSKSDFPAAVADVITLVSGVSYRIVGAVNMGTTRLVTNGANLVGLSLFADSITYTGTDPFLTITNCNFDCKNLRLSAVNADLVDINSTNAYTILFNSVIVDADTFGDIDSPNVFEFSQGAINVATDGMTFSGTPTEIMLTATGFYGLSGSGTYIDFGAAVFGFGGNLDVVGASLSTGETFLSGLPAGANFGVGLTMSGGFFNTSGGGTVLNGIDVNDLNVEFRNNIGIAHTDHRAMMYIAQGDEAVTTISGGDGDLGNPKVIAGAWTEIVAQRFTTDAAGRITYHNGSTNKFYRFTATLTVSPASGTNNEYHFAFAKDGVIVDHSISHIKVSNNNEFQITVQGDIEMTNDSYVELTVENLTGTVNVTCQNVNMGVDN